MNIRAWIRDPAVWSLLPGQENWDDLCSYSSASPDQIGFPPLSWEPCGEGCALAEVNQGYFDNAAFAALSTSAHDGVPLLRLSQASLADSITVQRTIDLSSGLTLAAVKQSKTGSINVGGIEYSVCSGLGYVRSGIEFGAGRTFEDRRPSVHLRGFWDRTERSWLWQLPWQTVEERGFATGYCSALSMEAGGRTFWTCLDVVYGAVTPGSSTYEILDTSSDGYVAAWSGDTMGELAIWPQKRGPQNVTSRIRGWRPDGGGVRTLVDGIPETCEVGLSPTHVVGFTNAGCSFGLNGRLWTAKRMDDDTLADFRLGPIFWPKPVHPPDPLKTWGDYIAVVWGEREYDTPSDRRRLLVARASDWSMRDLRGPEGHEVFGSTLTDDHLYVIFNMTAGGFGRFSHVYRYDLEKFDEIGTPVTPVAEPAAPAQR